MWPFKRAESRSANATETAINAIESYASGDAVKPDTLAIAEACIGLWSRAIASATIGPSDSGPLAGLNAHLLALVGRGLAVRGEAVVKIDVEGSSVRLIPASAWSLTGSADPRSWIYRIDLIGPSANLTETLTSEAVLHFRIGADSRASWKGRSPLSRSAATADLAAALESAFRKDLKIPIGRIFPIAKSHSMQQETIGVVGTLLKSGGLNLVPSDGDPAGRWQPLSYGPGLPQSLGDLRSEVMRDVVSAFGVPAALLAESGDGAGQREAWRRLWLGTIAPLGRVIEAELRSKLDPNAVVSFGALRAADEDSRSRAIARRATAFETLTRAGVERSRAARLCGLD